MIAESKVDFYAGILIFSFFSSSFTILSVSCLAIWKASSQSALATGFSVFSLNIVALPMRLVSTIRLYFSRSGQIR